MYYDDEARRFNFVSGLLFGAVLGAGLALLAAPQGRTRSGGSGARRAWKRRASRLGGNLTNSVSGAVEAGRKYLRR